MRRTPKPNKAGFTTKQPCPGFHKETEESRPFLKKALTMTPELTAIQKNRRTLRGMGMTSQGIQIIETYFKLKHRNRRVGYADVARVLGIHRSLVTRHFKRAEALNLVVRIGPTAILMAKKVLKLGLAKAKQIRKRLYSQRKSKFVDTRSTRKGNNNNSRVYDSGITRSQALQDLKAMYIPPHLRKNA